MKFLVLGCNGMAGHMISLYLKERGHDVLGVALTKSPLVNSIVGDAIDVYKRQSIYYLSVYTYKKTAALPE